MNTKLLHAKLLHVLCLSGLMLALVVFGPSAARAQGLGILAGANYNELSDLTEGDEETTFDNASGYHVGLFYDLTLGPLALRPAVVYVDVGEFDTDGDFQEEFDKFDLQLVEVPIDARFRLGSPFLKPYLMAGPVFRFNASDNDTAREAFEDISVAGNLGVGLELSLPVVGLTLYPEARYQFGLSRFTNDEFEVGGTTFRPSDDPQLNAFMLRLSVAF